MTSDREQAIKLVASLPGVLLNAATVREIIDDFSSADDAPHFRATVHLAERVIALERALRECLEVACAETCDDESQPTPIHTLECRRARAALNGTRESEASK